MERLKNTCPIYNMENPNPNYTVMLQNNFRSDKEIIDIPNRLFYKGQLRVSIRRPILHGRRLGWVFGVQIPSYLKCFYILFFTPLVFFIIILCLKGHYHFIILNPETKTWLHPYCIRYTFKLHFFLVNTHIEHNIFGLDSHVGD